MQPSQERTATQRLRGLLAHSIILGCWVVTPFVLAVALLKAGWSHGAKGFLLSIGIYLAVWMGPRKNSWGLLMWLPCLAEALAAPDDCRAGALLGSFTIGVAIYMMNCEAFSPSERVYRFLTETVALSMYYDKVELRGALDAIEPGRTMFAAHPHGIICTGWGMNMIWNSELHRRTGPIGFLIDPGLLYKNPLFRLLADLYRSKQRYFEVADRECITKAMRRGDSLSIVPGGFQDATAHQYGKHSTVIMRRKGFVKYCLQHGYRLTPVYSFGETETYYTWKGLLKFRLWLNSFGIPAVLIFGNPLIPFFPRPHTSILTYVGTALELPKVEKPTEEDVDHWHARYVEALRALFDKHKAEAGVPDAVLNII